MPAVPVLPSLVAVIVAEPGVMPATSPALVTVAVAGVTSTDATGMLVTVMDDVPLLPSLVAVIVAEPGVTPETSPELLTVATDVLLLDQVTARPERAAPFASRSVALSWTV